MYLPNKYTNWYNQIISNALLRTDTVGYTEKHHIIPKSLGGSNCKSNLVKLTAKEHFICHRLLVKMVTNDLKIKMIRAVWRMTVKGGNFQDRFTPSARVYESIRLQFGSLRKGQITPTHIKKKISNANKGKAAWNKNIPRTVEEKTLISIKRKEAALVSNAWNLGIAHSPETLAKIKERAVTRVKYTCQHCSKAIAGTNYFRWHGDNCKFKHR